MKALLKRIITCLLSFFLIFGQTYIVKASVQGWQKTDTSWTYLKSDGINQTGWLLTGGKWYYMDLNGIMKTGWILNNNKWYYLSNNGEMKTGWIESNKKSYYLNKNGDMAVNIKTPDGYTVDVSGAWNGAKSTVALHQPIYNGNVIREKLYSLGFEGLNGGLVLNKYGAKGTAENDYLEFSSGDNNCDMTIVIMNSNPETDKKLNTILNWILPTQGNKLYDILDNATIKSQTIELDGRKVQIDIQRNYWNILFGPVK